MFLRAIDRNFAALLEVEWPDVVQAHDVVGMRVREEDRIHARNARP